MVAPSEPSDLPAQLRAREDIPNEDIPAIIERAAQLQAQAEERALALSPQELEKVAEVLYLSGRGFDGSGFPADGPAGKDIPLNSRIIKLLTDLWYASPESGVDAAAIEALEINHRQYDPHLLEVTKACLLSEIDMPDQRLITKCYIRALRSGDILVDDILIEGTHELVLSRGHELTQTTIRRLEQFNHVSGIRQPIRVHRAEAEPARSEFYGT